MTITWQSVTLELGKLLIAALFGAGGLWGVQQLKADPKPVAQSVTISADELRKLYCPAPTKRAKVEGNAFGTSAK